MIARLVVVVPFTMVVPENTQFTVCTIEYQGYKISIFPPGRTDQPITGPQPTDAKVGGTVAFLANGLTIEFQKEQFDRSPGVPDGDPTVDPPSALVIDFLNFLLERLRYVARGFMVHRINSLFDLRWRLQYLNDDRSDLQQQAGAVRARGGFPFRFSFVPIHPEMWRHVFSLAQFEIPVWDGLRLDALESLPNVGTAVVLAFASLETFIANTLNAVAQRVNISASLWGWINKRRHFELNPSTEEQFDQLLKELVGHSLKENETLWTAFQNLRTARNKFVHEGTAKIGGQSVDEPGARLLLTRVDEIIAWVRQWVPDDVKWPAFDYSHVKTELTHVVLPAQPAQPEQTDPTIEGSSGTDPLAI